PLWRNGSLCPGTSERTAFLSGAQLGRALAVSENQARSNVHFLRRQRALEEPGMDRNDSADRTRRFHGGQSRAAFLSKIRRDAARMGLFSQGRGDCPLPTSVLSIPYLDRAA